MKIETLFSCVLCPSSYSTRQGLAGHMNKHKDVEFRQFNIRIPKEKRDAFMALCAKHNVTSCHMMLAMIDAYLKGDECGLTLVGSKNPQIVHIQQFFNTSPGIRDKFQVSDHVKGLKGTVLRPWLLSSKRLWPPSCEFTHEFWKPHLLVGCLKSKEMISLSACWSCFVKGDFRN